MRVIIAGPRDCNDYVSLLMAVHLAPFEITEVVWGCAKGVDMMGKRWADEHRVPDKPFPADWNRWGKGAGPKRNRQMSLYGDALIALWDGRSSGTGNMIQQMRVRKKPFYVHGIRGYRQDGLSDFS